MHLREGEYEKAHTDFFEAFKNYDESGSPRRTTCLKYLVLANMLMKSGINPFDSQETKPYKNDPEILAMTNLVSSYPYIYRNKIEEIIEEDLRTGLKDTKRRIAWDTVQEKYECCGVHNYTDWMGVYDVNVPSSIPDSCCGYPDCGESGSMAAWRIGCVEDAKDWLKENYLLLGLVCVVIGAIHVLLLIVTAALIILLRLNG